MRVCPVRKLLIKELEYTYDYANTCNFSSWEIYFFELLKDKVRVYRASYSKDDWKPLGKLYNNGLEGLYLDVSSYFSDINKEVKRY